MRWTKEEINLIKECSEMGSTHREIADFIFEDFGIVRTEGAIRSKCFKLGIKSIYNKKPNTTSYILNLPNDIKLIDEYVNSRTKILFKHICGYMWYAKPNNITNGSGCPKCAGKLKLTTKQYKMDVPDNIKVLGEYINNSTKIEHECLVCNNKWEVRPTNIKNGQGCPKCNRLGYYGNLTKEQADALDYPLYLYHVKLQYEDEIFFKYGLTKNNNRSRYDQYNIYKVIEELSFEEYDAWTAICKEKKCISNYTPKNKFNGYTECYIPRNRK